MSRVLVLLFALAFLPTLCRAQVDVANYQIDVTGEWISTNPSCGSNCTETMNMDFVYERNLDPSSGTTSPFGWIDLNTFQVDSSGFLGQFSFLPRFNPVNSPGLWAIYGISATDLPVFNSALDEVDLHDQTFFGPVPTSLILYSCPYSNNCANAYPGQYPADISANTTTTKIVAMPESDPTWQLLLVLAMVFAISLLVKHRLGLLRADLCASRT